MICTQIKEKYQKFVFVDKVNLNCWGACNKPPHTTYDAYYSIFIPVIIYLILSVQKLFTFLLFLHTLNFVQKLKTLILFWIVSLKNV